MNCVPPKPLDEIDFNTIEDSHVLSQVYEELLLRLGREGGIAGEFYTPRPIVGLMVKIVGPEIGKSIFDPFCGSCGFLIESYKRMKGLKELTIEDYEKLQKGTFHAQEKKPLPYLIGVMNCILHDILTPDIVRRNTLEEDIRNIPDAKRYDVILTNPPFGGKEGKQIQQNFPVRSQATELLALQYVMKKLRKGGRCGIVVPEGVLFRGDAFAQVKKELLENYDLHTIISLPSGVFANVTSSGQGPKTNLLFFDRTRKTNEIWYYDFAGYSEVVLKKKYTKANPVINDDFRDCYEKWKNRALSDFSWVAPVEEIKGFDLTARNPNRKEEAGHKPPEVLLSGIIEKEKRIGALLNELNGILDFVPYYYRVLDLSKNATFDEIKGAYRRLAKMYHPDVSIDPDTEKKSKKLTKCYLIRVNGHNMTDLKIAITNKMVDEWGFYIIRSKLFVRGLYVNNARGDYCIHMCKF